MGAWVGGLGRGLGRGFLGGFFANKKDELGVLLSIHPEKNF